MLWIPWGRRITMGDDQLRDQSLILKGFTGIGVEEKVEEEQHYAREHRFVFVLQKYYDYLMYTKMHNALVNHLCATSSVVRLQCFHP